MRAHLARARSSRDRPGSSAFSGSAMDSPIGMRGSRLASGSWNTIWKSFAQRAHVRPALRHPDRGPATPPRRRLGAASLQHGAGQGGLAAAGFAHHAQGLALMQGEADAIHRAQFLAAWRTGRLLTGKLTFRSSTVQQRCADRGRRAAWRLVQPRHRRQQHAGIVVLGRIEDVVRRAAVPPPRHGASPAPGRPVPAITPMSWLIRAMAVFLSVLSARRISRICACTVTSSAVVGSSAIIRSGPVMVAMAIITRWRMPPDSSWGYCLMRRALSGMRT